MHKYRLECLNVENGHMELVRSFEAKNDTAAVERADRFRKGRAAELWRSYRIISRWDAD